MSRVAILGGGWAGMAAAVHLVQAGAQVSLWESARHWGGRARALSIAGPPGSSQTWQVDNGQHILIGAYRDCLALMAHIGVPTATALYRQPLDLRDVHGQGLRLPDLPPPWDAALGIARAQGWSWSERLALLCRAARWQRQGFRCGAHDSVADLCTGLPARLLREFVDPLCISALNLPSPQASGQLFLRVLHDSLFAGRGGSHFLLPRTDLGTLLPDSAARWLEQRGATLHLGQRAQQLTPQAPQGWQVDGQAFDHVVLATPSHEAARLARTAGQHAPAHASACQHWADQAAALEHTAIGTVYAWAPPPASGQLLPTPMVALHSDAQAPAQFAFDKGQLGGPAGLLALVVSACTLPRHALQEQVLAQARAQLRLPQLQALQTVIEKRATFACTPGVQRPPMQIAPQLWACGDYVRGPYPATLEGAVRSGREVAQALVPPTV